MTKRKNFLNKYFFWLVNISKELDIIRNLFHDHKILIKSGLKILCSNCSYVNYCCVYNI